MPATSVSVTHQGTHTKLTACEAAAAAPTQETFDAAVSLLSVRNEVLIEVAKRSRPKSARCVADKAATDDDLEPLFEKSDLSDAEAALVATKFKAFSSQCGA
jgi:hypothetical protein